MHSRTVQNWQPDETGCVEAQCSTCEPLLQPSAVWWPLSLGELSILLPVPLGKRHLPLPSTGLLWLGYYGGLIGFVRVRMLTSQAILPLHSLVAAICE